MQYCIWGWEQVGELVMKRSAYGPSRSSVLLPSACVDKLGLSSSTLAGTLRRKA